MAYQFMIEAFQEKFMDSETKDFREVGEPKAVSLDDVLRKKWEDAVDKRTLQADMHDIAKLALEHSAVDLAYSASHIPPHIRLSLYENLPGRSAKIAFMTNADKTTRLTILREAPKKELSKLFEKMPADEATWVLDDLPSERFQEIMALLQKKKSEAIINMRKCSKRTAGRLMTDEFFSFEMEQTIGDAASVIRDAPHIDFTKGIYLVDPAGELQGYVPPRAMIVNPSNTPLKQVMKPIMHKVSVDASRQEVIDVVERYKIASLAVVDDLGLLIGVITSEDIVEALEDLADETMATIAGTAETPAVDQTIFQRFLARSPWLLVTLLSGFLNVGMMSSSGKHFADSFMFIFFFVPLVTGLSGNIGIQCSTVLVRSFALGSFSSMSRFDALLKELFSGLFSGLIFGIFCGISIFCFESFFGSGFGPSPFAISTVVSAGLMGACFAGTFLGVFSPIFFLKVGVDPAISSGPIITAFNDFISMTIYFFIAWGLHLLLFL